MPDTDPDPTSADTSSGVAVLDRAFALLAAFGLTDERLTLTELSRRTNLYKSTVLRLLAALEHGGYMRKLPDGLYAIGPEPLRLAAIYQRSFRVAHVIEPLLSQLSQASGETASFYVRRADKRVVLFRVEPARAVRFTIRVGEEFPVDQGASGKVLMAFSAPLLPDREASRNQFWAVSYGEREPETVSLAAPVFGVTGEFQGALTLSGPKSRMASSDTMLAACRLVVEAAQRATEALGGDGSPHTRSLEGLTSTMFQASG
jgi:DNA-binding IclR family transcriptional regulator